MKKPLPRTEYLAAAAAEHDRLVRAYEETLPCHPQLGAYLAANPVEGVTVIDRGDGLGPRADGWPEDMPHPDVDAWAAEQAKATEEAAAAGAKRAEEEAAAAAAAAAARAEAAATLEAAAATVQAALEKGDLSGPEVAAAYATIALAGAARLRG